jgi:release factor glutamine methyltransferase
MTDGGIADRVYQPAEDSALLAEAACEAVSSTQRVLDVGTGSGYVAARVAETGARVVGSDRNPYACRQARENGIEIVRADLTSAFGEVTFDVVTFNPPYLPTAPDDLPVGSDGREDDERDNGEDWMDVALSGGETGRAVIEPFLDTVSRVLRPRGIVLMLVSTLTGLDDVEIRAREAGFEVEQVAEESHFFERLVVLKLVASSG